MIATVTVVHPDTLRSLAWYFDQPEAVALVAIWCHETGAWRSDFARLNELPPAAFVSDAFDFRRWLELKA